MDLGRELEHYGRPTPIAITNATTIQQWYPGFTSSEVRAIGTMASPPSATFFVFSPAATRTGAVGLGALRFVAQGMGGDDRLIGRRIVIRFGRHRGADRCGARRGKALALRPLRPGRFGLLARGQAKGFGGHVIPAQHCTEVGCQPQCRCLPSRSRIRDRMSATRADAFVGVAVGPAFAGFETQMRTVAGANQRIHARVIRAARRFASPRSF